VHSAAVASFALLLGTQPIAAQTPNPLEITAAELGARLRLLASDAFEGRYPGTRGETLTTSYIISELASFGVRPAMPDASWLQPVRIVVHDPDPTSPDEARVSGRVKRALRVGHEIRLRNLSETAEVAAGGELVFVGYGIYAPTYHWDDFDGLDLHGKVAVALWGEPSVAEDTMLFNGRRASRFASRPDRVAEMERRGALGVLFVRPAAALPQPLGNSPRPARLLGDATADGVRFAGPISDSALVSLLPPDTPGLEELRASAARRGFRALPLGVRLDVRFRTRPRTILTHNVIGVVPGTEPARRDEHVVLSAHWDAFGIGSAVNGDSIYNGALDDGSGTTALLALARVFARAPQPRSLTFLFTTSEEWGLLGAEAYVRSGPVPMDRIIANLNLDDGIELFGRKRDVAPLGTELSSLGRTVQQVATRMGLRVSPDPFPAEGFFLRADNYPFARAGVPSLYMALGTDGDRHGKAWVEAKVQDYLDHHYHQPSDDDATVVLDLEGAKQFAEFVRNVASAVAGGARRPEWKAGGEFSRPKVP
jgi:hypothetical protein